MDNSSGERSQIPPVNISFDPTKQDLPRPEGANFFHFAHSGPEIELTVGYIDIARLVLGRQREPGNTYDIEPEITHRFVLSRLGFDILRAQINEIAPAIMGAANETHAMQPSAPHD